MKAIVTAGRNTNLRPPTHTKNKHLIPLANKPMLFYALEHIVSAGIKDIGVIVHEDAEEIKSACGDGSAFGASLTYIQQEKTLGLAHVIKSAQNFLQDSPYLVYLGDNIIFDNLAFLRDEFEKQGYNCMLALVKSANPERFGVPEFKNGAIIKVEERPVEPKSVYAVAGLYFYDNSARLALEHIKPSFRGDYEISDIHTWLAQNNYSVGYREIRDWWKDRGDPADLLEANRQLLGRLKPQGPYNAPAGVKIEGPVQIAASAKIGGHTLIRGPSIIGEHCLIKDSYIGPYTSVGNRAEIHSGDIDHSIIFEEASIVTTAKITDSLIGAGSVISAAGHEHPKGHKIVTGENSSISL